MRTFLASIVVLIAAAIAAGQETQPQTPPPQKPQPPITQKQSRRHLVPNPSSPKMGVKFETSDGVTIQGDFYPPKAGGVGDAPVAILIHMYPADRKSWKPLIPKLHEAGFAVLAYDIRGTGGSTEPEKLELQKKYRERDAKLFNDAWKDVEAARRWLEGQARCDVTRTVLIGASIGCSISLDYTSRDESVRAVVCLSPGTDYFGVDSKKHVKACGKRPILLVSPEGEYAQVEALVKASDGAAEGAKYAGGRENHGTKMFDAPYGEELMKRIVAHARNAAYAKAGA